MKFNEKDFYEAMNKQDALPRVAEVAFFKIMADIRWDPKNLLEKLEAAMGAGIADDHHIYVRAIYKHQGVSKTATVQRSIHNKVAIASGRNQFIETIRHETQAAAAGVAEAILKTFGTTIKEEMDRVNKNIAEMARKTQFMSPSQMILIHPDREKEVQDLIDQHHRKEGLLAGGFKIVTSASIPKDQILMSDGTRDGSALLKNVGRPGQQPEEKKETLQDLLSRRARDAKWK